ncbi:MAG TPA: NUDIX domain-containing protein [Ramlibacter sp.]|nr:NUDIX domain-containing protein [Ramlibacter sp.]
MPVTSAGLLLFRRGAAGLEVLLAHPGGPYWARRDDGAWTIPKGELHPGEDPLAGALREFQEETGGTPAGPYASIGEVRLKSGKRVLGWACEGDFDPRALRCNLFEVEWPPRSGRRQQYPEIDRVGWFTPDEARRKLLPAQVPFIDRLVPPA